MFYTASVESTHWRVVWIPRNPGQGHTPLMFAIPTSANLPNPLVVSRWAPLIIGVTVAALVFYGFSHTVDRALIHFQGTPPPLILYVHALVSSAWLFLFVAQSALVRTGNVRLHRRLGLWGLGLGAAVSLVGVDTVYVMRWREIESGGGDAAVAFLSIPLDSLVGFAIPFLMGAWWRKKPEIHRRLMLLATCTLTFAALARVPALGDSGAPVITDILMIVAAAAELVGHETRSPGLCDRYSAGDRVSSVEFLSCPSSALGWLVIAKFLLGAQ